LTARLKMPAGFDDKLLELWTRTPYIAAVIDKSFRIRLANYQLAALLEVKSAGALVGRTWADFLPESLEDTYRQIFETILAGDLTQFGEYTGDVCAQSGTIHRVKWFHSPFLGSEENDTLILSVGLPYRFKLTIADDLRRAWKESILVHRAAIRAIKKLPSKTDPSNSCQLSEVIS
jgi:PAS domain-containing protein